ncbi:hypothetical protein PAMA_013293 [Pampus argenteus]
MSSSACQWTYLRPCVFSSLVVLCLIVMFFTYYNPDINFRTLEFFTEKEKYCQPCPQVLCCEGKHTNYTDANCSSVQHLSPDDTKKTQAPTADPEPDTIVLIWKYPFGIKHDLTCSIYNITGCHLTDDRSLYHKAHGVLFHHRDIDRTWANMPKDPRPWFQKWVWFNMESPANSAPIPKSNNLFNLTCSYRLESNIPVPYATLVPAVTTGETTFKLPSKDKLVCWIVSNWNSKFERVHFYEELKKHITINAYGQALGQRVSRENYLQIISSCKFYLSFENSVYKDYITEKLYNPMDLGSVPIVLGPPRQNYEDHIPGDSFIHVHDFSTPKELAERLLYLDKNNDEYMRYFDWKSKFQVKSHYFGQEHACKTCGYLQKHRGYQAFHDLNKWYWG